MSYPTQDVHCSSIYQRVIGLNVISENLEDLAKKENFRLVRGRCPGLHKHILSYFKIQSSLHFSRPVSYFCSNGIKRECYVYGTVWFLFESATKDQNFGISSRLLWIEKMTFSYLQICTQIPVPMIKFNI